MGKYVQVKNGKPYEPKIPKDFKTTVVSQVPVPTVRAFWSQAIVSGKIELGLQPRINRAMELASQDIALEANRLLPMAMRNSAWGFTGGRRDIVDTGVLMQSMDVKMTSAGLQISYSEPYAALVHYGGYIQPYGNRNAELVYLPGRPWVDAVLTGNGPVESIDYDAIYRNAFSKIFS